MITERHGVRLITVEDAPTIATERDATDLVGEALGADAEMVVVPVARLHDDFFQLRTGLAGAVAQKFVNYRLRLVILGDISRYVAESTALRDFVTETNRGRQLWFVADDAELERRLAPA